MQTKLSSAKSKSFFSKLAFAICSLSFVLTACTGATTSIGGGGGSYGGGGGVAISFPVGESSPQNSRTSNVNSKTQSGELAMKNDANNGSYIGSNLFKPYPKNDCYEPMKPDRDDSAGSFMLYRQQLDTYRWCIDTYVKNAQNDIQDIETKAHNAQRQYKLFVNRP